MVLAKQAEGKLIGHRFPYASSASGEELLYAHRIHGSGWVRVPPARVATTGLMATDVYEILYSETKPVQRSGACGVDFYLLDEGPALFDIGRPFGADPSFRFVLFSTRNHSNAPH